MRWQFYNPNDPVEAARHDATLRSIQFWWRTFESKTSDLSALFSGQTKWDLPGWMDRTLHRIHDGLFWEFGPAVHGDGHRLVITPETNHHLRPLVQTILQLAPNLPGWEFYDHRLSENLEQAVASVQGRTGGDISETLVRASVGEHRRIDLLYCSPSCGSADDAQSNNDAFIATETLLGEDVLNKWIGVIEVAPLQKPKGLKRLLQPKSEGIAGLIPLDRLQPTVTALIDSLRDQLPDRPWHAVEEATWTLYELQPQQADDYANQFDMFVGKTVFPEMWIAAHTGHIFSSERFSRQGETFCYVKLDGSQGLEEQKFADKGEIEDALDAALKPSGLGCHVGGGTGLRYSYIDLALTDLAQGVEAVRNTLAAGNVHRRSWIQFFDTDLAAEWVGIYDDSPAPPM